MSAASGDLFADRLTAARSDNCLRDPLAEVFARVTPAWKPVTDAFLASPEGESLVRYVDARVADGAVVYPGTVFRALELTSPDDVRVIIVGQDPYHGPGQAQGLAFSVGAGQKLPPSLRNMLKEVEADTGATSQCQGDLSDWARQGVLLLNTSLTVEDGQPQSHAGRGWEALTDALLMHIALRPRPVVFLLWGGSAQRKRVFLDKPPHRVLTANHPSPLSARRPPEPFIGCRHFSKANNLLLEIQPGTSPIRW
ncbi:MAG: uracil-DNA glycosylase [Burkholderiales bacterium]|nr:uracil-DNA glycosylase [Burkholderiales bacterium]